MFEVYISRESLSICDYCLYNGSLAVVSPQAVWSCQCSLCVQRGRVNMASEQVCFQCEM